MPDLFSKSEFPDYKRVDIHMLDPRSITILPEFNGRRDLPPIDDLLKEFPDPKIGQIMNVVITKREGVPVLLDGHRRWRAALQLTEEKKGPFEDGVFKLRCSNFQGTPLECFIVTVKANASRRESLPEDDGYNISRLIHNFGLSEDDIAVRVYGKTTLDGKPDVKWVRDRMALADLTPEALDALKSGVLKPKAAVALAKLSAKIQRERLASGVPLTVASIKRDGLSPLQAPAVQDGGGVKSKFGRVEACALVQKYIDTDVSGFVAEMSAENAVRTILGDLLVEMQKQ